MKLHDVTDEIVHDMLGLSIFLDIIAFCIWISSYPASDMVAGLVIFSILGNLLASIGIFACFMDADVIVYSEVRAVVTDVFAILAYSLIYAVLFTVPILKYSFPVILLVFLVIFKNFMVVGIHELGHDYVTHCLGPE